MFGFRVSLIVNRINIHDVDWHEVQMKGEIFQDEIYSKKIFFFLEDIKIY